MSRQFEKRAKKVQKMTRDGLVEQNLVTGEETRVSQRGQDFLLRKGQPPDTNGETITPSASASGRTRRAARNAQPDTAQVSERQPDAVQERNGRQHKSSYHSRFVNDTFSPEQQASFSPDIQPGTNQAADETTAAEPQHLSEIRAMEPNAIEHPDKLQFNEGAEGSAPSGVPRQTSVLQHGTSYSRKFIPEARTPTASGNQQTTPTAAGAENQPPKPANPSRLQFSEGETPPAAAPAPDKKLTRLQNRADTVNAKLEQARENLPVNKKAARSRIYAEQRKKTQRGLQFEKEAAAKPSALMGKPAAAGKAAVNMAAGGANRMFHSKIYEAEHENVGIKAAHRAEMAGKSVADTGVRSVRSAYRFHRNAPYRKVERLEKQAVKANIKLSYRKAINENPQLKSNYLSRFIQKQKIKRQYATAYRKAKRAGTAAKAGGGILKRITEAVAGLVRAHPMIVATIAVILLMFFFLSSMLSSCSNMAAGGLSAIISGSYTATDADITDAGMSYTEWETNLQTQIDNTEIDHSGYDEYRYDLDEIGHDPYALMAYLTARYQNFLYADIETDLQEVFDEQYSLTFTSEVEIRYSDPGDEDEDGDLEPYEWHILNVKLETEPFADVLAGRMDDAETDRFGVYMETGGNRQYLINPFAFHWEPYISCLYGWRVHPITGARDFHTGLDIAVALGTPILAGQDGTVTFSGSNGDYGLMVQIEGANGLASRYAHCSALLVTVGQEVRKGDIIAKVGSTGASTGPHLHLEVIKDGQRLDPIYFAESE